MEGRRTGVAPLRWSKKPGLFFRSKTRPKPDFEGGSENQSPEVSPDFLAEEAPNWWALVKASAKWNEDLTQRRSE